MTIRLLIVSSDPSFVEEAETCLRGLNCTAFAVTTASAAMKLMDKICFNILVCQFTEKLVNTNGNSFAFFDMDMLIFAFPRTQHDYKNFNKFDFHILRSIVFDLASTQASCA